MTTATKTVTMMDLRRNIGEIFDEMLYQHKEFVIKRRNKIVGVMKLEQKEVKENTQPETREQKIDRLFGSMSYLTDKEVEEWIHASDDSAADRRHAKQLEAVWQGKNPY